MKPHLINVAMPSMTRSIAVLNNNVLSEIRIQTKATESEMLSATDSQTSVFPPYIKAHSFAGVHASVKPDSYVLMYALWY